MHVSTFEKLRELIDDLQNERDLLYTELRRTRGQLEACLETIRSFQKHE